MLLVDDRVDVLDEQEPLTDIVKVVELAFEDLAALVGLGQYFDLVGLDALLHIVHVLLEVADDAFDQVVLLVVFIDHVLEGGLPRENRGAVILAEDVQAYVKRLRHGGASLQVAVGLLEVGVPLIFKELVADQADEGQLSEVSVLVVELRAVLDQVPEVPEPKELVLRLDDRLLYLAEV